MNYLKLEVWRKAAQELFRAKEAEMILRKELFEETFPDATEGVNTLELQDGWLLKATYPMVRSLDQKRMPEVLAALKRLKAPARLIKTDYKLSLTEYDRAEAEVKAVIDGVLTTTPGTPALKLVPPKSGGAQ